MVPDSVLVITWGEIVRGREANAATALANGQAYYDRLQVEGRIESYEVILLGHAGGGELQGLILVRGSYDALARLRGDDEFVKFVIQTGMVLEDLRITPGVTGEGIAHRMALYGAAAQDAAA